MLTVSTNISAMSITRNMKIADGKSLSASEKTASGLRVNRSGDDAASLAIAEKMKAQIKGLQMASKNCSDGYSFFQIGDGALSEIEEMLKRSRELTIQAMNDTNIDADREKINTEIQQLYTEIDETAERTEYNGINILKKLDPVEVETMANVPVENALVSRYSMTAANIKNVMETIHWNSTTLGNTVDARITIDGHTYSTPILLDAEIQAIDPNFLGSSPNTGFVAEMYKTGTNDDGSTYTYITDEDKDYFASVLSQALTNGIGKKLPSSVDKPEILVGFSDTGFLVVGTKNGDLINPNTCAPAGYPSFGHDFFHTMFLPNQQGVTANFPATVMEQKFPPRELYIQSGANENQGKLYKWNTVSLEQLGLKDVFGKMSNVLTIDAAEKNLATLDKAGEYISSIHTSFGGFMNGLEHNISMRDISHENLSASASKLVDSDMALVTMERTKAEIVSNACTAMLAQSRASANNVLAII